MTEPPPLFEESNNGSAKEKAAGFRCFQRSFARNAKGKERTKHRSTRALRRSLKGPRPAQQTLRIGSQLAQRRLSTFFFPFFSPAMLSRFPPRPVHSLCDQAGSIRSITPASELYNAQAGVVTCRPNSVLPANAGSEANGFPKKK